MRLKLCILSLLALGLSGCALPPAVVIASYVLDAGSYATTGKSTTDHALSWVFQEDCALMGVFSGDVCHPEESYAMADAGVLEPLPAPGTPTALSALVTSPQDLPSLAAFQPGDPALQPLLAEGTRARSAMLGGAYFLSDGLALDPQSGQVASATP